MISLPIRRTLTLPTFLHYLWYKYVHICIFLLFSFTQSFGLFYNTSVIPLWPAINTTRLEFQLLIGLNIANPVCFAVELTGCPSIDGKINICLNPCRVASYAGILAIY